MDSTVALLMSNSLNIVHLLNVQVREQGRFYGSTDKTYTKTKPASLKRNSCEEYNYIGRRLTARCPESA